MLSRRGFMQTGIASVALIAAPGVVHALRTQEDAPVQYSGLLTPKHLKEQGYYMLLGFSNFNMNYGTLFRNFDRTEGREVVRKYGHHDPVNDVWWLKMGMREEPEHPKETKAILTLAGDLTPAFHAQHILMCKDSDVMAELKNRTGAGINVPPQMHNTDTKLIVQELVLREGRSTVDLIVL